MKAECNFLRISHSPFIVPDERTNLFYINLVFRFRFRQAVILCRTNEPLIRYEVLIPITNPFVFAFVFVFVLAHEQAISMRYLILQYVKKTFSL